MASAAVSSGSAAKTRRSSCCRSIPRWPSTRASLTPSANGSPSSAACASPPTPGRSGSRPTATAASTLVSEYVKGWRLADLLDVAETENLTFDIGVVMLLLRQLLPTAAMLSNQSRDTASGALGPEHLLLTPQGRVVLTDYVLGPAIETLGWDPERLWTLAAGGHAARAPATGRIAARRRRAGGRHDALAGGRPPLARRRVPRSPRGAGGQRPPAHADRRRRAALRRTAQLAHARPAAPRAQLRDALRRPARARAAARHRDRAHRAAHGARRGDGAPRAADAGLRAADAAGRVAGAAAASTCRRPTTTGRCQRWRSTSRPSRRPSRHHRRSVTTWRTSTAAVAEPPEPAGDGRSVAAATPEPTPAPAPVLPSAARRAGARSCRASSQRRCQRQPASDARAFSGGESPRTAASASRRTRRGRAGARADRCRPTPVVASAARRGGAWRSWCSSRAACIGWQLSRPSEGLSGDGELVVQSRPEGARVAVDDEDRGQTPLTLRLVARHPRAAAAGRHRGAARHSPADPRRRADGAVRGDAGRLHHRRARGAQRAVERRASPSTARPAGSTPLTLRDVAPGDYQVVLERAGWKSTQTVRVEPGATAQLVVPIR